MTVMRTAQYNKYDMRGVVLRWVRGLFFGRPLTKEDHLRERLRVCAAAGIQPESVENFWVGLEDLRDRVRPKTTDSGSAPFIAHPPAKIQHLT